jgi:D-alanine transaminase
LILPGSPTTRRSSRADGLPFEIRPVARAEALAADEMWLSSSTKEVLAVTTLDGAPFAGGAPGPVFRRLHAVFQRKKRAA